MHNKVHSQIKIPDWPPACSRHKTVTQNYKKAEQEIARNENKHRKKTPSMESVISDCARVIEKPEGKKRIMNTAHA